MQDKGLQTSQTSLIPGAQCCQGSVSPFSLLVSTSLPCHSWTGLAQRPEDWLPIFFQLFHFPYKLISWSQRSFLLALVMGLLTLFSSCWWWACELGGMGRVRTQDWQPQHTRQERTITTTLYSKTFVQCLQWGELNSSRVWRNRKSLLTAGFQQRR